MMRPSRGQRDMLRELIVALKGFSIDMHSSVLKSLYS